MAKLKGRDVSVSIEIEADKVERVALARDADITVNCDVVEFTSPLSGRARRFRAGRYTWNINISTLIAESPQPVKLLKLLKSGGTLIITMEASLAGEDLIEGDYYYLTGRAVPQMWKLGAPLQGLATFSVSLVGDGELELIV